MTAPTTTPAAEQFLAQVELQLADLPADDRAELLEDLSLHLAALAEEADDRPLATRLGSPADYAAELRTAAGLPPRSAVGDKVATKARIRQRATAVRDSRVFHMVRAFLPQLRPAWWVLRGYLLVAVPCLWDIDGSRDFPLPAPSGSHLLGLVLVAVAVVASIAVGRRQLPRVLMIGVLAADLILLVAAGNLIKDFEWRTADSRVVHVWSGFNLFVDSPLITQSHGPVTNILAFGADGKPLEGVLLFDQDGRPLLTGRQLWFADRCRRVLNPPRATDGTPVPYSYPKRYVLDPEGKSLSGLPLTPGQCKTLTAPKVVLPVLPGASATGLKPAAARP